MPVSSSSSPSPSDSVAPSLPSSAGNGGDKVEDGVAAVSSRSYPAVGGKTAPAEPNSNPYDGESEEGVEAWEEPAKPAPRLTSGSKRSRADRAAEVHSLEEKRRRTRINEKMKALQNLIPNSNKRDRLSMQSMLDEAVEYVKQLQLQVQTMQTWELLAASSQPSSSASGPSTALVMVPSASGATPASPAVTPVASSVAPPGTALAVPLAVPFSELCKFQAALEAATVARTEAEAKVLFLERKLQESIARVRQLECELGIDRTPPPPAAGEGSSGASTELLRSQLQLEAAEEMVAKLRQELKLVTDKFQDTVAVRLRAEWMVERRSEELKKLNTKYDDLKARFDTVTLMLTRSRDDPAPDSVKELLADPVMARALFPQAEIEATAASRLRQEVSVAGEADPLKPPYRHHVRQPMQVAEPSPGYDTAVVTTEGEVPAKNGTAAAVVTTEGEVPAKNGTAAAVVTTEGEVPAKNGTAAVVVKMEDEVPASEEWDCSR